MADQCHQRDVLVTINRPTKEDFKNLKPSAVVLGFLRPLDEPAELLLALEHGLTTTGGARHILGFTDLVEQQGRLNEAIMPLKVVGFAPRNLLRILPLAITMLLKGKIPNPFGHALPGLSQIQALIRRVRRTMPPA